jgi:signal transduction histidine kinase
MLESAGIGDGVLDPRLIVTSGHEHTLEALEGVPANDGDSTLLIEALMCRGCFNGPGTSSPEPGVLRRRRVAEFASDSLYRQLDGSLSPFVDNVQPVDLSRTFTSHEQRGGQEPTDDEIREILGRTNKFFPEDELNCGACGYRTCREKARAVYVGMAEEAMCLPFILEQAERVCHELNVPWSDLRDVHRHLINSEKLASMGQMAAGVAHELNNPLSTILLYSHILQRKLKDREDLNHDLQLMASESTRCKKIIENLLDFARQNRVKAEKVSIEKLIKQATEGILSNSPASSGRDIRIVTDIAPGLEAELDHDQMIQVLVNLIKNGEEAMEDKGGTLRVTAYEVPDTHRIRISVTDEGSGIAAAAKDKIFQPFFTTKSIGKGTGLGLPISYGIVKMHNGNIWFEEEPEGGTTFHVEIPMTRPSGERSSP